MGTTVKHLAIIAAVAALFVLSIAYPFLPGGHDQLALPLSTMAQVFGVAGLALVPVGLSWLAMPRHGFVLAVLSVAVGTLVAIILALVATFSVGNVFGMLTLAIWVFVVIQLRPRLERAKRKDGAPFNPVPVYLVLLPVIALVSQLALAAPITRSSRDRAIENAGELISAIEAYRTTHGRYPLSLQAQHKDYNPDVVGVEMYVYAPNGDGYDLAFEQPKFILDRVGTREWVVYNPRGQHRLYSHAAWRLLPAGEPQGWYASGETGHRGWRYFWLD